MNKGLDACRHWPSGRTLPTNSSGVNRVSMSSSMAKDTMIIFIAIFAEYRNKGRDGARYRKNSTMRALISYGNQARDGASDRKNATLFNITVRETTRALISYGNKGHDGTSYHANSTLLKELCSSGVGRSRATAMLCSSGVGRSCWHEFLTVTTMLCSSGVGRRSRGRKLTTYRQ